jgi:hypothetical protein
MPHATCKSAQSVLCYIMVDPETYTSENGISFLNKRVI